MSGVVIDIDGARPISAELVAEVAAFCDAAEDRGARRAVVVRTSGAPRAPWSDGITVGLVGKWEQVLRRLERLPAATIAVADGECGGPALDALLATDYRIATSTTRLTVPRLADAPWPGMALYRLAHRGTAAARRAVLFGTPIGAVDALAAHLVDEITDDPAAALAAVSRLADGVDGVELAIRRHLLSDAATIGFEEALGGHLAACDRALRRASGAVS